MVKQLRGIKSESENRGEEGQSLIEMAVIVPFLAILLLGAIELGQAFNAYISLINAARAGATYASLYPEVRNCADPPETDSSSIGDLCLEYSDRVKEDMIGAGFDSNLVHPFPPVLYSPNGVTVYANCPITTTVTYSLSTFSSGMSLPFFGRLGLPDVYTIRYSLSVPIREAEDQACLPS